MNKSTGILASLVLGLAIACVGLLVGLLLKPDNNVDHQALNNIKKPPGTPIISESIESEDFEKAFDEPTNEGDSGGDTSDHESTTVLQLPWEKNVRLPKTVQPIHYDLYLYPQLEEGLFSGKVDIEVENSEATDHFLAHVKYLDVQVAKLFKYGQEVELIETLEFKQNEFYVLRTGQTANPGTYVLHFGKFQH